MAAFSGQQCDLVRGERCCFSFLNTCWVCLWSIQVCGTLLPFLFCPGLPVSFFLYPSLSLALGQHLTLTIREQELLHFPPISGDKTHWDAFVKSETSHKSKCSGFWRWFALCFSAEASLDRLWEVSWGECSFVKCLQTWAFRFGAFLPVGY